MKDTHVECVNIALRTSNHGPIIAHPHENSVCEITTNSLEKHASIHTLYLTSRGVVGVGLEGPPAFYVGYFSL